METQENYIKNKGKPFIKSAYSLLIVTMFMMWFFVVKSLAQPYPTFSNQDISNAVRSELLVNEKIGFYSVEVTTSGGIVTLEGQVDNLYEKNKAASIAKAVRGVRGVVNLIDIHNLAITETEIEQNVRDALLLNSATEHFKIDVEVNNSVVTLKGAVDSWQEKEIANKVASSVNGVKKVRNEVAFVAPKVRSDYDIEKDIKSLIRNDLRLDDGLLDVVVSDGEVSLSGIVGSLQEKGWAYYNAWVEGVSLVDSTSVQVNALERNERLRADKFAVRSDAEVTEAIQDAFFYDPRVKQFDIMILIDDGTVVLRGEVDNLASKKAAEKTARNVVGVRMVKNFIKVAIEDVPDNNALEEKVNRALQLSSVAHDEDYAVKATMGRVTLKGWVDSEMEKILVEDIVEDVLGVTFVENQLKVIPNHNPKDAVNVNWLDWYRADPANIPSDDAVIENEIAYQMAWSPFIDEKDIEIEVNQGEAVLTGTVGSLREKQQATINALEGGAFSVKNKTIIQYEDEVENP